MCVEMAAVTQQPAHGCDFGKNSRRRIKTVADHWPGDVVSMLTAYANDEGYENVFSEPVVSLIRPDDVLIAISASGNSPNILRAVEAAKRCEGVTIGLTGFDGGKLKDLVDHAIIVPGDTIGMVEDFHMIIGHIVTICLS